MQERRAWRKSEMQRKTIELFAKGLAPVIRQFVAQQVEPLKQRIAELEQRENNLKYLGTWQASGEYQRGNFISHDGSMWCATRDTRSRPGTSNDWQLCVKRGRDGKDAGR